MARARKKPQRIIATLRGTDDDAARLASEARSVGLSVNQTLRFVLGLDDPARPDGVLSDGGAWDARRDLIAAQTLLREAIARANRHPHNPQWLEITVDRDWLDAAMLAATPRVRRRRR